MSSQGRSRRSKPTRRFSSTRSKRTQRSFRTSRRRSKRATERFTFRAALSKPDPTRQGDQYEQYEQLIAPPPNPLFEQWGNDTLYPPPNPSAEPTTNDVLFQCGVQCSNQEICRHEKEGSGSFFCTYHKKDAEASTKEYHKNYSIDNQLDSANAMRIIPLRIRVYLMYRNSLNNSSTHLSSQDKLRLEKVAQGHLSYITSNLLPHWDMATYGARPVDADSLVTSFMEWTPEINELVRAKYKPTSYNWKFATVVDVERYEIKVKFNGFDDVSTLGREYVKPSYFAMPPKTVFVQYVLDKKPCVMLLKGSGILRNMEWSCLPHQPVWDLLAIIFNGEHIMFTNIVSKQATLEGLVTLPLPSSLPERLEKEKPFEMDKWYDQNLLQNPHFAKYMNDEFSEVMCLHDAVIKKSDFSINVHDAFNCDATNGILTSAITDKVLMYHYNQARQILTEKELLRAKKYLSTSKKILVSFTLSTPVEILEDNVIREMLDIYMTFTDEGGDKIELANILKRAFGTEVTSEKLEYYSKLVLASRIVRRAMNESNMTWLDDPTKKEQTIEFLNTVLGELVLKSQFPQKVQALLKSSG